MRACTEDFLAKVTEGVVHGVYKVMTRSSFSVIQRQQESGDILPLHHNLAYEPQTVVEGLGCFDQRP